jgi:competence protein ComFB
MDLHNTIEDMVIAKTDEIFHALEHEGKSGDFCTCSQCRLDVICYALNRTLPHYIVSNRGVSRVRWAGIEQQQHVADIAALIQEGLHKVSHNQRPNSPDSGETAAIDPNEPVYNVPTIVGRVFDGENFAPLSDIYVELLWNGELVPMMNVNWQNPYHIVPNTEGSFSFWPTPDKASGLNKHKVFEYNLRVMAPGRETLIHFFKIPVASEIRQAGSFALNRTHKLPDLYMFPPGEAEKNG